jgi:hypothetical protein
MIYIMSKMPLFDQQNFRSNLWYHLAETVAYTFTCKIKFTLLCYVITAWLKCLTIMYIFVN